MFHAKGAQEATPGEDLFNFSLGADTKGAINLSLGQMVTFSFKRLEHLSTFFGTFGLMKPYLKQHGDSLLTFNFEVRADTLVPRVQAGGDMWQQLVQCRSGGRSCACTGGALVKQNEVQTRVLPSIPDFSWLTKYLLMFMLYSHS